jgi:hypothetical protein
MDHSQLSREARKHGFHLVRWPTRNRPDDWPRDVVGRPFEVGDIYMDCYGALCAAVSVSEDYECLRCVFIDGEGGVYRDQCGAPAVAFDHRDQVYQSLILPEFMVPEDSLAALQAGLEEYQKNKAQAEVLNND